MKPWEQQPGETDRAHEAFLLYLHMSRQERSLYEVSVHLYGEKAENERRKPRRHVEAWSSKHDWMDRVKAFDRQQLQRRLDELAERRRRDHLARIESLEKMREKLLEAMDELEPGDASWKDVTNGLTKITRELRGEYGDDVTRIEHTGAEGGPVDVVGRVKKEHGLSREALKAIGRGASRTLSKQDEEDE